MRTFEIALERIRLSFGLSVFGYVIMPEHVHLLISEPEQGTLAEANQVAEAMCVAASLECSTFKFVFQL